MKLKNPEVRLENTNFCQASCTICPREKMTRNKCTMSLEHFKLLANQAKELGAETISVFGYGEPFMDAGLAEKIEVCTLNGLDTFVTSNAGLLNVAWAKKVLRAGLKHIRFSVHGISAPDYEKVHKGLPYMEVMSNIFNFITINNERLDHACKVSVTAIPQKEEHVEGIKAFWEKHVDYLELWKPHNWTDGRSFRSVEKRKKTCGRPFSGPVQIQADGQMIVCCFDFDGKIVVGNTHNESIEDILKGDKFNEIRRKHETGELKGLPCESCDQLNIEEDNPLLYSSRDPDRNINTTSSTKFKIQGE